MGGIYLGNALLTHSTVENIIQDNDFYIKADGNHINWVNEEVYILNISEPTNFTLNDMLVAKEEYRDIILQINNLDTNGVKTTNYLVLESFDANSLINQFTNDNFIASINNNSTITIRQNIKMTSVTETNKGLEQKFWRGTKEEYEALNVKDEDTMYIVIDEEGGSIKADWNENDAEAPDYIKNRTHYKELKDEILIDNQEVFVWSSGYGQIQGNLVVIPNNVYDITLDGVLYNCTAREVYDEDFYAIVLGNLEVFASFENMPPNNGEPFCIVIYSDGSAQLHEDSFGVSILSISGLTEVFTKIDKNYLPNSNVVNGIGAYSIVEGYNTSATGDWGSHAEGLETVASGTGSHAEGQKSEATGYWSHAEGYNTEASGESAHAEGYNTVASGDSSHAEGIFTSATSWEAHAEGYGSSASGNYSHAENYYSRASGNSSHAEGYWTAASGQVSHAEGNYTIASSDYQHAQGKYNIDDTDDVYAHIVGNGSSNSNRSNAHTLDWSGNAWFAGDVYVGSASGKNKDDGSVKLATMNDLLSLQNYSWNDLQDKPFYEEISEVPVLTEQTLEIDGSGAIDINSITLITGKTYSVTFNEVKYERTAWFDDYLGATLFGNGWLVLGSYSFTGEPFCLKNIGNTLTVVTNATGSYTIQITSKEITIHRLEEKYLPESVATIADIETAIGTAIGGSY